MSNAVIFIGDALTATGFRLAGARVHSPPAEKLAEVFRLALSQGRLILVGAACARRLPAGELQDALHSPRPLLVIVPDVRDTETPPDLDLEVRQTLGIA